MGRTFGLHIHIGSLLSYLCTINLGSSFYHNETKRVAPFSMERIFTKEVERFTKQGKSFVGV
jgi:hypothetical protein